MTKRNTKRGGSCQRRPASTVRRRTSAPRAIGVLAPSFVFVGDAIFVQIPIVLCVSCASADASTSSGPRHAHLYSQSVGRHRRPLCFCSAPLAATVLVVLVLVLVQTSRAAVAAGARPPPPRNLEKDSCRSARTARRTLVTATSAMAAATTTTATVRVTLEAGFWEYLRPGQTTIPTTNEVAVVEATAPVPSTSDSLAHPKSVPPTKTSSSVLPSRIAQTTTEAGDSIKTPARPRGTGERGATLVGNGGVRHPAPQFRRL